VTALAGTEELEEFFPEKPLAMGYLNAKAQPQKSSMKIA
jgi:hypothetical protein